MKKEKHLAEQVVNQMTDRLPVCSFCGNVLDKITMEEGGSGVVYTTFKFNEKEENFEKIEQNIELYSSSWLQFTCPECGSLVKGDDIAERVLGLEELNGN